MNDNHRRVMDSNQRHHRREYNDRRERSLSPESRADRRRSRHRIPKPPPRRPPPVETYSDEEGGDDIAVFAPPDDLGCIFAQHDNKIEAKVEPLPPDQTTICSPSQELVKQEVSQEFRQAIYQLPWALATETEISNPMHKLSQEVVNLVNYMLPSPEEHVTREWSIGAVRSCVHRSFHAPYDGGNCFADIHVFGSVQVGTYLPDSGIDLEIQFVGYHESKERLLQELGDRLKSSGLLARNRYFIFTDSAGEKTLEFEIKRTSHRIIIHTQPHGGFKVPSILVDLMEDKLWKESYRALVVLVKFLLRQKGLNNKQHGGLSSYAIELLVAHFIENERKETYYHGVLEFAANQFLGHLLAKFLENFSEFMFEEQIIHLPGSWSMLKREDFPTTHFVIADPSDANRNAAFNSYRAKDIRSSFVSVINAISEAYESNTEIYTKEVFTDRRSSKRRELKRRFEQQNGFGGKIMKPINDLKDCKSIVSFEALKQSANSVVLNSREQRLVALARWKSSAEDAATV